MLKRLATSLIICSSLLTTSLNAATPSDVFFETRKLIVDIQALRQQQNSQHQAEIPGIQLGKTPLHVYSKALELLEKVQRLQTSEQQAALKIPPFASREYSPADVKQLIVLAQQAVAAINQAKGATASEKAEFKLGKTPSDVYEQVWLASNLLDGLVPALKPANVFRNALIIEAALEQIAKHQRVKLSVTPVAISSGKTPSDVNIAAFRLLYKVATLERQLEMDPPIVPSYPAQRIKPEHVYDTTANVIAELVRIATYLEAGDLRRDFAMPAANTTPSQVYQKIATLNLVADQLLNNK